MLCQIFPATQRQPADFDQTLMQRAANASVGESVSAIWHAQQSLVVPRTYRRFAAFANACQHSAANGWPVVVRQSGGGLVPQGSGIVNFSLAQRLDGPPLAHADAVYQQLCGIVVQALAQLGIHSTPGAVPGSFCDGRYNLAVQTAQGLQKIAGTAQCWQRIRPTAASANVQVVLAHAVILADIDAAQLIQHLNTFEDTLGNPTRYRATSVVSVRDFIAGTHSVQRLQQALSQSAQAE